MICSQLNVRNDAQGHYDRYREADWTACKRSWCTAPVKPHIEARRDSNGFEVQSTLTGIQELQLQLLLHALTGEIDSGGRNGDRASMS